MKVLMFGWEFPPHITGGLGTACYGLTKALSVYRDLDITFVVPKAFGDEDKTVAKFIGAEHVAVNQINYRRKAQAGKNSILFKAWYYFPKPERARPI